MAPAMLMVAFRQDEYHLQVVWLAALTGVVVAASDWRHWYLPRAWRWPVIAWALVIAATWAVIAGREIDFSLVAMRSADTPNGLMGGPPAHSSAWIVSVALGHLLAFLWMDLLWARFGHGRLGRMERLVLAPMLGSAVIGSLAGLYQEHIDINWLNPQIWVELGRAAGLMLDANSFGTSAGLWSAAGVALMWRLQRSTLAGIVVFLVLAAAMWASGSRTALIATMVGAVGIAAALSHRGWKAKLVPVSALLVAATLVVAVSFASRNIDDEGSPLKRALDALTSAREMNASQFVTELWARQGYGTAAIRAIREHPVTGVGVGAFNQLSTDYFYLEAGTMIRPDNAQNWWRQQVAELGFVGAIPSIVLSFVLFALLGKPAPPERRSASIAVKTTMVATGLISLLGVTTQHPALLLTFVTFAVWLAMLVGITPDASATVGSTRTRRVWWTGAVLIAAVTATGQAWTARGDLRVPHRATRAGFPYVYGFSAAEPSTDYGELRWTAREALAQMRVQHIFFELTTWTLHPDAAQNPVRIRVWQDGALVVDVESRDNAPMKHLLQMQPGQRHVVIEIETSRTFANGRGLRLAARWLRERPPTT
jgi:O-antigen ligase